MTSACDETHTAACADLPDDTAVLKAMVIAAESAVIAANERADRLERILAVVNRMLFGKRSEKLTPDQLSLVLEDRDIALGEADDLVDQNQAAAGQKVKAARKPRDPDAPRPSLPAHLPRIEREIVPAVTTCSCCGETLCRIGEDRAERLHVIPSHYVVMVTVRPKLACAKGCEGVRQALASPSIIPGGLPTETMLADVLVKKYADHLPLYRQSQILARQGITLSRATLANWVGRAASRLKPIVALMERDLLNSDKLFVDETTVKLLDPGKGKVKTGYFWAMAKDERPYAGIDPPMLVYHYLPGRGVAWAKKLLNAYCGILQIDGWHAYDQFMDPKRPGGPNTLAYCWAHVRRHFTDAGDNAPVAHDALRQIAALYAIEKDIRGSTAAKRHAARQARSKPLIDTLHEWLLERQKRLLKASATRGAINYALNRWDGLICFLDDGRIEMDSNTVERSMRPVALQRKNALFAGHELGAENWAAIASLIETCKLGGHNPQAYLADVLARLATMKDGDSLEPLMPTNWIDTKAAQPQVNLTHVAVAA